MLIWKFFLWSNISHLSLVELLWSCRPQTHEAIRFSDGARAFARRGKALHLCDKVKPLFYISKVSSFSRHLLIAVRIFIAIIIFSCSALQSGPFGDQFHFTLKTNTNSIISQLRTPVKKFTWSKAEYTL